MFITIIGLICLVAVVWAVFPLVWTKKDESPDLQSVNSRLLEDQIAELGVDLEQGIIGKDQYEAARLDLQRTFLETATESDINPSLHAKGDPFLVLLIVIVLPISAYFIYKQVGTNPDTIIYAADQTTASGPHAASGVNDVNAMLKAVRARAEADSDDLESWQLLAQTLHIMEDYDGAIKAYSHLIDKGVEDADIYANYADVLASKSGGLLLASPAYEWTQKALKLNPDHQQALWIAGTAAYYSKDYGLAKQFWQHLLTLLEPGSDSYNVIKGNLSQLEKEVSAQ